MTPKDKFKIDVIPSNNNDDKSKIKQYDHTLAHGYLNT